MNYVKKYCAKLQNDGSMVLYCDFCCKIHYRSYHKKFLKTIFTGTDEKVLGKNNIYKAYFEIHPNYFVPFLGSSSGYPYKYINNL